MVIYLLFCFIFSTVYCAPIKDESQATIVFYTYNNYGGGNYKFSYLTSNGIFRKEKGILVNKGEPDEHIEVQGSYSYKRPDGKTERITYTANKNGIKFETTLPMFKKMSVSPALFATLLGK